MAHFKYILLRKNANTDFFGYNHIVQEKRCDMLMEKSDSFSNLREVIS